MAIIDALKTTLAETDVNTIVTVQLGPTGTQFQVKALELMQALGVQPKPKPVEPIGSSRQASLAGGAASPTTPSEVIRVQVFNTPFLRIRAQPTTVSAEVGRLKENDIVEVSSSSSVTANGFQWQRLMDGRGWIAIDYTITLPSLASEAPEARLAAWRAPMVATQRGVGGSAGGWAPGDRELDLTRRNRVEFVLIVAYEPGQAANTISKFRNSGVKNFVIRAATHEVPTQNPQWFIDRTIPVLREYASALNTSRDMMVVIHNEPNLVKEGWGTAWRDGAEFANWFLTVARTYRTILPGVRIGFPAMSPGGDVSGIRFDEPRFMQGAMPAIAEADFGTVHYYWVNPDGSGMNPPVSLWRQWFGNKSIIATEVGPIDATTITSKAMKAAYDLFARIDIPAVGWVLDGAGAWRNAAWTTNNIILDN